MIKQYLQHRKAKKKLKALQEGYIVAINAYFTGDLSIIEIESFIDYQNCPHAKGISKACAMLRHINLTDEDESLYTPYQETTEQRLAVEDYYDGRSR